MSELDAGLSGICLGACTRIESPAAGHNMCDVLAEHTARLTTEVSTWAMSTARHRMNRMTRRSTCAGVVRDMAGASMADLPPSSPPAPQHASVRTEA